MPTYAFGEAVPTPKPPPWFCLVGVDFGCLQDHSAAACLEWRQAAEPRYQLTALKRWARGTPYLSVTADLAKFVKTLPPCVLVLDGTGVGVAVVEVIVRELADQGVQAGLITVVITAGQSQRVAGRGIWHVAKRCLVSAGMAVLGSRRLAIADLPERATLVEELKNFRVKVNPENGYESFESLTGRHDDLCLATLLALWAAETIPDFRPRSPTRLARQLAPY